MMTSWLANPLKTLSDVERFEAEMPLDERLPGNSVYEVLLRAAEEFGDRTTDSSSCSRIPTPPHGENAPRSNESTL